MLEDEPEFDPESEPMFGQLAELPPPCLPGAGAGAGAVPDESDPDESDPDELEPVSGCVVVGPLLLEELSVCRVRHRGSAAEHDPGESESGHCVFESNGDVVHLPSSCLGSSMRDEPGITL